MSLTASTPPSVSPPAPRRRERTPGRGIARWCVDHRWRTLLAGLLVLAGAVVLLGGGLKTGAAADKLVALGFTNVRAVAGGLGVWKAAGQPVRTVPRAL